MNTLPTQSCTRPPGTSNTALPRKGSTATSPAFTRRARSTLSSAQRKILESARRCSVSRMYRSNAATVLGWSSAAQAGHLVCRRRGRRGGRGRGGFGHINGGVESHAAVVGRATVPGGRMAFGDGAGGFDSYSSSFSSSSSFRGKIEDEEEKD